MSVTVPMLTDIGLARSQRTVKIKLPFSVATGATASTVAYLTTENSPNILAEAGLAGSQAILTQAKIDNLLGSTNEVVASIAFSATALEADNTIGFVLDCKGQIDSVDLVRTEATVTAGGATIGRIGKGTKTALANAAITDPQVFVTASGNLAGRAKLTGIAATGAIGYCVFEIDAILK